MNSCSSGSLQSSNTCDEEHDACFDSSSIFFVDADIDASTTSFLSPAATNNGGGGTTNKPITRPRGASTLGGGGGGRSVAAAWPRSSKKRSRASLRAPATVLTTDEANFCAMVQEFTGIPTPAFVTSAAAAAAAALDARNPPPGARLDDILIGSVNPLLSKICSHHPAMIINPFSSPAAVPPFTDGIASLTKTQTNNLQNSFFDHQMQQQGGAVGDFDIPSSIWVAEDHGTRKTPPAGEASEEEFAGKFSYAPPPPPQSAGSIFSSDIV